ncbi:MAG TPA: hypothetical protein DDW21_00065 [Verrucomicrobiales bacterium]|nr:MAG: hypothetical protein B9S37_02655 [Verrucomicrobiae bacterium Tous-C3TDCM]PAZ07294.1 MAG: hypothetical protein CAK88_00895 [Verrucomicrobiae bacterium AMD-G2]HBE21866.1 hypothetical protein [Verrucomicrobiales bacterium]
MQELLSALLAREASLHSDLILGVSAKPRLGKTGHSFRPMWPFAMLGCLNLYHSPHNLRRYWHDS